jgi:hypothetical protein
MLKQYLEKVGEGLFTHACISSLVITDLDQAQSSAGSINTRTGWIIVTVLYEASCY